MKTLQISEVAKRTGVPATTLRYYEDIGLIGPAVRSANGYRTYDERDLERLAVISRAKKLDISLDDVRDLVAAWDSEECFTVQHRLDGIVKIRLQETRERIADLTRLAVQLEQTSVRLSADPQEGPCTDDCACTAPQSGHDGGVRAHPAANAVFLKLMPAAALPGADGLGAACTLERNALPHRLEEWSRAIAAATSRTTVDAGIALRFDHDPDVAAGLARLAADEYGCCSFFNFTIAVNAAGICLEVRAPAEAQDALHAIFGDAV